MDQKHQKCPQNVFLSICDPTQFFFQKSDSVSFVPLWCPNLMQKNIKTNELSQGTDQWTDKGD